MAITETVKGRLVILDVDRSTQQPIEEILGHVQTMRTPPTCKRVVIYLSGFKPARLAGIDRLFEEMPRQGNVGYLIAVPTQLAKTADDLASQYSGKDGRAPFTAGPKPIVESIASNYC